MEALGNPLNTLVLACATVIEEMLPFLPPGIHHEVFDFGLHTNPARLRLALQEVIDRAGGQYETILLGYGLCSQALVGLRANGCRLVAPPVDDCIAIFLGSRRAYAQEFQKEPGTYYLTKGWIEVGDTPFSDYERTVLRHGRELADEVYRMMMGNYKRLALIDTGQTGMEKYRRYTQECADRFGLLFEEISGSDSLIRKLISGSWNEEFVVIEPGEAFQLSQFIAD